MFMFSPSSSSSSSFSVKIVFYQLFDVLCVDLFFVFVLRVNVFFISFVTECLSFLCLESIQGPLLHCISEISQFGSQALQSPILTVTGKSIHACNYCIEPTTSVTSWHSRSMCEVTCRAFFPNSRTLSYIKCTQAYLEMKILQLFLYVFFIVANCCFFLHYLHLK